MKTKRIAYISILLSITLIISIIENFVPPIIPVLPYAKIGIANFVILFCLIVLKPYEVYIIVVLKCFIVALFSGKMSLLLYSLPAGLVSLTVMLLLLKCNLFSITAISITSAIVHNLVQICVASAIIQSASVFVYLPYLSLFGAISGFFTGLLCYLLVKYLPKKYLYIQENL
ncbi:MAG: Gx transporter family protein [Clostridia bacterium]